MLARECFESLPLSDLYLTLNFFLKSPPAPEYGATKVHNDVSPVLAQTFTDPFTVFSAKRFPGVPGEFTRLE